MNKLVNDVQHRGSSSPVPMKHDNGVPSASRNELASISFRNRPYKQEILDDPNSIPDHSHVLSSAMSAKDMMQPTAAQRYPQPVIENPIDDPGPPKIALAPHIGSSLSNSNIMDRSMLGSLPPQRTARSPRDAMRHRRRLEAMRSRNGMQ
jgi:hypothetical protein